MTYTLQKKSLYKAWLVVLLLYFNFPFFLKSFVFLQQLFIWGACLLYVLINIDIVLNNGGRNAIQNDSNRMFLYLYLIFVIMVVLVPVLHNTGELNYFRRIFYFTMRLVQYCALYIFTAKKIKQNQITIYMECFTTSCVLYVIISVFMLLNPWFREFWGTIIRVTETEERVAGELMYITRFGLAGFSGFQATFMCSVGVVFSLYLILQKHMATRHFLKMIACLFGNFFYGRIGMVISFVCILLFLGYYIVRKKDVKLLLATGISAFLIFSYIAYLYNANTAVSVGIRWIFSPVINLVTTGRFNSSSFNSLLEMYFLPGSETLLFGDGRYINPDGTYYMHTDAGFMRLMLYGGVLVQGIIYFSIVFLLISCVCTLKKYSRFGYVFMLVLFLILFLLFEFKGEIYFNFLAVLLPLALCTQNVKYSLVNSK